MKLSQEEITEYVSGLVARARKAQETAAGYSQEQVDRLVRAMCYNISGKPEIIEELAKLAYEETKMGDVASKIAKMSGKPKGVLYEILQQKSVGVVEEDWERGLVKLAKPVGVIAALVPSTQPEMIPLIKGMFAVKSRNAVIFSPHPRGKKTTYRTVELLRGVLKRYGAPEDLLVCAEPEYISVALSNEIMKQCDLIMATGGSPMVKAAYSSGTPAYGVGAGNACIVVDETADLKDAAAKIKASKVFDQAAGCSCDNSVIIQKDVYHDMIRELEAVGAYLCTAEEKEKLRKAIWPNWPKDHVLNRDVVARPVEEIMRIAGIEAPEGCSFLLVEEEGSGPDFPFSGEKLCLVIAVYKYGAFQEAIDRVNANHAYSGSGHSCGIYSTNDERILEYALKTKTARVAVRLPQSSVNGGNWNCGMPFTGSLGCGTWGGNIASENIVLKHYLNTTWVIRPVTRTPPTDEALFGDVIE